MVNPAILGAEAGQFTAVLQVFFEAGHNGTGKTTVVKLSPGGCVQERSFFFAEVLCQVGASCFFGFEIDFYSKAAFPLDNIGLVSKVMQVFAGNWVSGRNDHMGLLAINAVAFGWQLLKSVEHNSGDARQAGPMSRLPKAEKVLAAG